METTIQHLITGRLEDLACQVEELFRQGLHEDAEMLRDEGLALATAYDEGDLFMYLPDFTLQ